MSRYEYLKCDFPQCKAKLDRPVFADRDPLRQVTGKEWRYFMDVVSGHDGRDTGIHLCPDCFAKFKRGRSDLG